MKKLIKPKAIPRKEILRENEHLRTKIKCLEIDKSHLLKALEIKALTENSDLLDIIDRYLRNTHNIENKESPRQAFINILKNKEIVQIQCESPIYRIAGQYGDTHNIYTGRREITLKIIV